MFTYITQPFDGKNGYLSADKHFAHFTDEIAFEFIDFWQKLQIELKFFFILLHFQTMQYFSLKLYKNHPLRHLVNYTVNKIIPFQFNSAHHDMAPDLIWKIMAPFIIYVRRRLFMKYGSKLWILICSQNSFWCAF